MTDRLDEGRLRARLRTAGVDGLAPLQIAPEPMWRVVTHGRWAVPLWGRLRELTEETGWYPVILGDAEHSDEPADVYGADVPAERLIADGERLRPDPARWTDERRRSLRKQLAELGEHRLLEMMDQEAAENETAGEWPTDVEPQNGFVLPTNILTMEPLERVAVALLPTRRGWEAPAYLRFGGWNECPPPDQQVAIMKSWHERFGAEPVGLGHDIVELRVARPPRDRAGALALAREQFGYCSDVVDQGMGSIEALAASLLDGRTWYFWWD